MVEKVKTEETDEKKMHDELDRLIQEKNIPCKRMDFSNPEHVKEFFDDDPYEW